MRALVLLVLSLAVTLEASSHDDLRALWKLKSDRQAFDLASQYYQEEGDAALEDYLLALAKVGRWPELFELWQGKKLSDSLMKALAWEVLEQGFSQSQTTLKLEALEAASYTSSAKALAMIEQGLVDSKPALRQMAATLCYRFRDERLAKTLMREVEQEENTEVLKAQLNVLASLKPQGFESWAKKQLSPKGRLSASSQEQLLIAWMQNRKEPSQEELFSWAEEPSLVSVSLGLASRCPELLSQEQVEELTEYLKSSQTQVLLSTQACLAYRAASLPAKTVEALELQLNDPRDEVAIGCLFTLQIHSQDPYRYRSFWRRWLLGEQTQSSPFRRQLAAAALSRVGERGQPILKEMFFALAESSTPQVENAATLAYGLLKGGEREPKMAQALLQFLEKSEQVQFYSHPLLGFEGLGPCQVYHRLDVPNFPELVNQAARLQLIQTLVIAGWKEEGVAALKKYLNSNEWGIGLYAASCLLREEREKGIEWLLPLLDDDNDNTRLQAALALALWGKDERAKQRLISGYRTAPSRLKPLILEGLSELATVEDLDFLRLALQEPFLSLRCKAASAILAALER